MTSRTSVATIKKTSAILQVLILVVSMCLPILLINSRASGAELTSRYVDMSSVTSSGGVSTEGSGRDGGDTAGQDVTYTIGFTAGTTGNIGGVVIDFCSNSPITGDACTAPTGFDTNEATLGIANQTGVTDFVVDTTNSTANTVILTRTPASVSAATAIEIDLGTTAASDGFTNPTSTGTFYARILTYAVTATAQAYVPGTPGAYVDDGGVAMAVANEITITARVQEVLQFCIGTTDSGSSGDCTDISGTAIDLGVVDSSTVQASAADAGLGMIRTNANGGAVIYYKAEQNTSSGKLKVAGASCSGTLTTDQCFNSTGTTQNSIVAGTEEFGMTLTDIDLTNGGATTALACDTNYDGDGSCGGGAATGYAWDDSGSFDTIASASSVLDDEMFNMQFAATASATTPTGIYTVTANFVATSTF